MKSILILITKKEYTKDILYGKNIADFPDFSPCKGVFEKFGELRLTGRGEYFARSGEVMEYAGGIVSGGFKYSLMSSDGNNRVIGFSLDDSLLIDHESVMHSTKMRTDLIALEDSEVIVIPAKIMQEKLNRDHELNMNLMMGLFEQLYDQFLEFSNHTPGQRYLRLLDRYPRITDIASYGDIPRISISLAVSFKGYRYKYVITESGTDAKADTCGCSGVGALIGIAGKLSGNIG